MRARWVRVSKKREAEPASSEYTGYETASEGKVHHHHVHHHHHKGEEAIEEGSVLAGILSQLEDEKPKTWAAHEGTRDGCMHILKMEFNEVMDAHKRADVELLEDELEDLAAACILAIEKLRS